MKMELNRNELTEAVKCYLGKQGIDVDSKDVSIKLSKNSTIVTVEDKQIETLVDEDGNTPFGVEV